MILQFDGVYGTRQNGENRICIGDYRYNLCTLHVLHYKTREMG